MYKKNFMNFQKTLIPTKSNFPFDNAVQIYLQNIYFTPKLNYELRRDGWLVKDIQ